MRPSRAAWCDALPLLGAVALLWGLAACWAGRLGHPFDLEWMEGGMLAHAWRLQRGLPVYTSPTADWVPYVYPPGYASMLSLAGSSLDYGFGRSLSVMGTLAAAAAIPFITARRGGGLTPGLLGAASFLLTYRASGAFMDLVRPDGLALGLAAWSIALALDGRRGTDVAGGLLLCASFLVKHNLAGLGLPLALGLWGWRGWRVGARFGFSAALPALAMVGFLQWRSDGGFLTYLLRVPSSHPMVWDRAWPGTPGEIAHWLTPTLLVAGVGLVAAARRAESAVPRGVGWAFAGVGGALAALAALALPEVAGVVSPHPLALGVTSFALGSVVAVGVVAGLTDAVERRVDGRFWLAWGLFIMVWVLAALMRAHNGGFMNVLMPVHWLCCGLAALVIAQWRANKPGWASAVTGAVVFVVQLVWIQQLLQLTPIVPTDRDREAGRALVRAIASHCEGPVFSPYAAWLPVQAGGAPSPHLIAIWDVQHKRGPLFKHMKAYSQAVAQHHYACVIDGGRRPLAYGVPEHYVRLRTVTANGHALSPKTGWPVRPRDILVPRDR